MATQPIYEEEEGQARFPRWEALMKRIEEDNERTRATLTDMERRVSAEENKRSEG